MQIGLTKAVNEKVKEKNMNAPDAIDLAFCWDTHLIKVGRKNVLLIVNVSSRYAIAMTDIEQRNWRYYPLYITQAIRIAMEHQGYLKEQIEQYFALAGEVVLTKTHGRKSVGDMNRIALDAQYVNVELEPNTKYQEKMCDFFNQTICTPSGFEEYGYPKEMFHEDMQRLGICKGNARGQKKAQIIDFAEYSKNKT